MSGPLSKKVHAAKKHSAGQATHQLLFSGHNKKYKERGKLNSQTARQGTAGSQTNMKPATSDTSAGGSCYEVRISHDSVFEKDHLQIRRAITET
jgi:hypothetical protein